MLTRAEFKAACNTFILKYSSDPGCSGTFKNWQWVDHPSFPTYGFMTRNTYHIRMAAASLLYEGDVGTDEPDDATASPSAECLICQQHVVYSASFQVPAFYFTLHYPSGAPLSLDEVVRTSLFKYRLSEGTATTTFALTPPTSPFPLLSQGEHPTLGVPCWYLHPCETCKALEELLHEVEEPCWSATARLVRWIELWFLVVECVLALSDY